MKNLSSALSFISIMIACNWSKRCNLGKLIDATVNSLPTALFATAVQIPEATIAAVLPHDSKDLGHGPVFKKEIRVCFLDNGQILEKAPPQLLFSKPDNSRTKQFLQRIIEAGRL